MTKEALVKSMVHKFGSPMTTQILTMMIDEDAKVRTNINNIGTFLKDTVLRNDDMHVDRGKSFKMPQPQNGKKIPEVLQVPKVGKIVEVPVPQFVEKIVEVSVPQVVEKIIEVPFIEVVKNVIEKVVDVPVTQIQTIEKSIEPPVQVGEHSVKASVAAMLMERPQRDLKPGAKFLWLVGAATDSPKVLTGSILRVGYGRFSKEYRVDRGEWGESWFDKNLCSPDIDL